MNILEPLAQPNVRHFSRWCIKTVRGVYLYDKSGAPIKYPKV